MPTLLLFLMSALFSGYAAADESCQALADKIASEYAAAHNMSTANRTSKCRAYALVIADTFKESEQCAHPSDQDIVKKKIQPISKLAVQETDQYCGGN